MDKTAIVLQPGKTTGRAAFRIIRQSTKIKNKKMTDFCKVSGLSRMAIHNWRTGSQDPIDSSLLKMARGLKAWGYAVTVKQGD